MTAASRSRFPLVLLLAISALVELLLNRVATRLAGPPQSELSALLFGSGAPFTQHFTGLLGFGVFSWGATIFLRDRNLLRLPDRMVFTFLAALFLPLAGMGLVVPLPKSVAPHLATAFGLLVLGLTVGFLRRPAALRAKLGVICLVGPLLLHCYWTLTQQLPALAPSGRLGELPAQLFEIAENMVVVGAFASFLFFAPFPRRSSLFSPIPVTAAALVTAAVALLIRYHYPEAVQAAYHGLGLNVPPPSLHVLMHLSALFFFVLTIATLALRKGPERETALGLLLLGTSGFQLQAPYQLLLTLTGLMTVMRAAIAAGADGEAPATMPGWAEGAGPTPAAWGEFLPRLAAACSRPEAAGEAVLLQHQGQQVAHVRGKRDGLPFTLRILTGARGVDRLEVVLGEPGSGDPPLTLQRGRGLRGLRVAGKAGGRAVTVAPELDRELQVSEAGGGLIPERPDGARGPGAATALADPELQATLLQLLHGWVGIWPGEGLHYVARPDADGWPLPLAEIGFSPEVAATDEVVALVALLSSLGRRFRLPRA